MIGWLADAFLRSLLRDSRACSWCERRRGAAGAGRGAERQDVSERREEEENPTRARRNRPRKHAATRPPKWQPDRGTIRASDAARVHTIHVIECVLRSEGRFGGPRVRFSARLSALTAVRRAGRTSRTDSYVNAAKQLRSGPRSAFQRRSGPHVQLVWAVGSTDGHTPCGHGLPGALQVAAGRG